MAVAIEAEPHGQRGVLLDRRHLIDAAVAADAADALVHVDRVVEVDELGNLVDPAPLERLVLEEALAHRLEERALVPDLRVAVETELRRRNAGRRRLVDRVVAVAAVDPLVTRVVAVIELQRLLDGILHAARVGRAGVQHQTSRNAHRPRRHDKQRDLRERVVLRSKERTHPRSASIYAELGGRVKRSIREITCAITQRRSTSFVDRALDPMRDAQRLRDLRRSETDLAHHEAGQAAG